MSETKDYNTGTFIRSVDFEIDDCRDLVAIQNKLLYLAQAEKNVLEKLKNSDKVMQTGEYQQVYKNIANQFNDCYRVLNQRRNNLMTVSAAQENFAKQEFLVRVVKRQEIENRYQLKLLKFKNKLYARECATKFKEERSKLREEATAGKPQTTAPYRVHQALVQALKRRHPRNFFSLPP